MPLGLRLGVAPSLPAEVDLFRRPARRHHRGSRCPPSSSSGLGTSLPLPGSSGSPDCCPLGSSFFPLLSPRGAPSLQGPQEHRHPQPCTPHLASPAFPNMSPEPGVPLGFPARKMEKMSQGSAGSGRPQESHT